jgi:hypothetical protein
MEALMNNASKIALLAFAVGLAACGDSAVAPTNQATTSEPQSQALNPATLGSTASLSAWDTIRFNIVIDPSRKTYYNLGAGNLITFPARSLCDPYRSSYGVGQWDKPCQVASQPLTVTAKAWIDGYGHPHVDFSPSVRFVPSTNPTNWVMLSFTDYAASWLGSSVIGYCRDANDKNCKDEASDDPTMLTVKDPITGKLTRRIKHFSGYNVFSGRDDGGDLSSSFSVGVANSGKIR